MDFNLPQRLLLTLQTRTGAACKAVSYMVKCSKLQEKPCCEVFFAKGFCSYCANLKLKDCRNKAFVLSLDKS